MTIYIVTDIKTVPYEGDYAAVVNTTQHHSRNGAEERYHTALATAARSDQYPAYSAVLMTAEGYVLESRCYEHPVEPETEPETETEGEGE